MRLSIVILLTQFVLCLCSCTKSSGNQNETNNGQGGSGGGNKTESFSYDLTYNDCKTEKHTFSSKQEMCDGLKDESLNKGCAQQLREDYFKLNCPGQEFKPQPQKVETTPVEKPKDPVVSAPTPDHTASPGPAQDLKSVGDTQIIFVRPSIYGSDVCDKIINRSTLFEIAKKSLSSIITKDTQTQDAQFSISLENTGLDITYLTPSSGMYLSFLSIGSTPIQKDQNDKIINLYQSLKYYFGSSRTAAPDIYFTDNLKCAKKNDKLYYVEDFLEYNTPRSISLFQYGYKELSLNSNIEIISEVDGNCTVTQKLSTRQLVAKDESSISLGYQSYGGGNRSIELETYKDSNNPVTKFDKVASITLSSNRQIADRLVDYLSQTEKPLKLTNSAQCEDQTQIAGPFYIKSGIKNAKGEVILPAVQ